MTFVLDALRLLADHDPAVRIQGLSDIVRKSGIKAAHKILLTSLTDINDNVVVEALRLLRSSLTEPLLPQDTEALWNGLLQLVQRKTAQRGVRREGLLCIAALATFDCNARLASSGKRLHDTVFIAACDLCISDADEDVRMEAFTLITGLQQIDALLVRQAFAKGRLEELAEAVPDSACGLFVHGMEDEFERVRLACMRAVFCHTLAASMSVVESAVDPIIDAFNDDAASVRLAALQTLTSICIIHRVRLDAEKVDLSLHLLIDAHADIRVAVQNLLSVAVLSDAECIRLAFKGFTRCLARYPEDVSLLMATSSKVGANHVSLVLDLIPSLLRIDKFFVPVEPRVEDCNYLLVLAALLNAAHAEAGVAEHLPGFIFKQFHYIRAKYPHCIPSFRQHCLQDLFYCAPNTPM